MCLSHSASLRSGKSVRNCAPRDSLRSLAATTIASATVEHVPELDRSDHVLVEDRAAIVDRRVRRLLLEPADDLVGLLQSLGVAEHRDVIVHRVAELGLDRRHAPAGAVTLEDPGEPALGVRRARAGCLRHRHARATGSPHARRRDGRRSACRAASWRRGGCRRGPRRRRPRPRHTARGSCVTPSLSVLTPPMM